MALTPEDILAKRFQVTKFREGYDQDEVDDYLDDIVVELRKILSDNEALRTKSALPADEEVEVQPFPVASEPATPSADEDTDQSRSIIELAHKLHADHVQEGRVKRDQIIKDAQVQAARIVRDAEAQAREVLNQLELDRRTVEESISDLKRFETEYRANLRDYIQGQLENILSEEAYSDLMEDVEPARAADVSIDYYSQEPEALGGESEEVEEEETEAVEPSASEAKEIDIDYLEADEPKSDKKKD
jgi:DivIVA domain-containing protein